MAERKSTRTAHNFIDLTGYRFGRLAVVSRIDRIGYAVIWLCRCDCGNDKRVRGNDLRSGKIRSCGCLLSEVSKSRATRHSMSESREYQSWCSAKARCHNPKNLAFHNYGDRGIFMSEEWKQSFQSFYQDMGPCPEGMSLDRIDNNGPYGNGNCRWTDRLTQNSNQRRTLFITHQGETLTAKEWAKRLGVSYSTVYRRHTLGLPLMGRNKRGS